MAYDTHSVISEKEIWQLVSQLKNDEIGCFDIPDEYWLHPIIVKETRKLGIRKSNKRGYDIIRCVFFVEEIILHEMEQHDIESIFSDFRSYYEFLDGDIYENACYFNYNFSQTEISTYDIDLSKINNIALTNVTIKDISLDFSAEELKQYEELEHEKAFRKKWIAKFNSCNTYDSFQKVLNNYNKSKFSRNDLPFFFYNFIFADKDNAFDIIMKYVSSGEYLSDYIVKELCHIYDPKKVLDNYNYSDGSKTTIYRHKKKLKDYINRLNNNEVKCDHHSYFDKDTHYFCEQLSYYIGDESQGFPNTTIYRYFETFEELTEYLKNDLSGCDLSKALLPDIDFSIYKTDAYTKLPIRSPNDLVYSLYKGYDREEECFVVKQRWLNENGQTIRKRTNTFYYFFDFAFFLGNDLSNADLLFCDGLDNIDDFSNIDLTNAKLQSRVLDKLGTQYTLNTIDTTNIVSFPPVMKNEEETAPALKMKRDLSSSIEINWHYREVYYISDLHLLHRLQNADCKSNIDVIYIIQQIIDKILNKCGNIILIGGDTSSNFDVFSTFIQLLRESMDEKGKNTTVIFLLGNHELWGFPDYSLKKIVRKYESVITKHKMYLLHNDIIYMDDYNGIQKITTNTLLSASKQMLREQLKSARIIFFGGLAFSGYNEKFNANNGIYRQTINRNQEVAESKAFEKIYNIVCETLPNKKNVIIFTHTPQQDWCSDNHPQPGFIYVNGHTHRNYFYDDGEYRIYADNQIGYKHENPTLKYFYVDGEYDLFSEYGDGIYKITKEQYINFYRGKNIGMQFTKDIYILYMLKKNGYYCFIHESQLGHLTILNGGAPSRLEVDDINYYYNNMDTIIAYINHPLDKYTCIQKQIANEIKSIGGYGTIHGAIIDIDFYNHIYVNPYDLTITGYWASDIIHKKVFPSIPRLLKENCPSLYANYSKLLNKKTENAVMINNDRKKELEVPPMLYLDTDIYRASLEIKKMQKLNSHILATWHEPIQELLE